MRGGIGNMMKQAQQMQAKMQRAQEEIAQLELEGSAGGGLVKVVMSGTHQVRSVHIDPGVMDDREMLEDLLTTALNDAVKQVEAAVSTRMAAVTGGLGLPPGIKLPF